VAETAHAVKTPRQQRSRDSLERILKTAESLIRTKGFEALTVAEVVRLSRTSIGTLYARFEDKTAVLHAVQERVHGQEEAAVQAAVEAVAWETLSLEETVRRLVEIKREATQGNDKLWEAFVVQGATDPVVRQRGYRHKAAIEDLEVEILMPHAARLGHPDPEAVARVASRIWQAVKEEQVQRSKSGVNVPGPVSQDLLMESLPDVVIAYLRTPAPTSG